MLCVQLMVLVCVLLVVVSDFEGEYEVLGPVTAGDNTVPRFQRGSVVRITTGAPVPEGADAVVQVHSSCVCMLVMVGGRHSAARAYGRWERRETHSYHKSCVPWLRHPTQRCRHCPGKRMNVFCLFMCKGRRSASERQPHRPC